MELSKMFKSYEEALEHALYKLDYDLADEGVYFKICCNVRNEYWIDDYYKGWN